MARRHIHFLTLALLVVSLASLAAQPERVLADAMGHIYRLRSYTAFDWITAHYQKGVLTLQGFARTEQLKQQAEAAARKSRGIEEVINHIEMLPALSSDDDLRIRAYVALYGSSALERYAPGGQLSALSRSELQDTARLGLEGTDVGRGPHAIHIVVSGARILLHGEVKATGDRRIAESMLRALPGVLGVTNQLRVAGQQ